MDNGARRVLLPADNKRDFADIPSDVLDKLQIVFFSDPVNAALRALEVEITHPSGEPNRPAWTLLPMCPARRASSSRNEAGGASATSYNGAAADCL